MIHVMVMAEISVVPIGTGQTSVSFYVARALESISDVDGLRCHLNAMGTILEADDMATILEASGTMIETLHNLGAARISAIIKIDSRRDKHDTISGKVESVHQHMA